MTAKREDPRVVPDADAEQAASAPVALSLRHLAIGVLVEAEEQVQRRAASPVGTRLAAARLVRLAERGRRAEENYRRRADDVVRHAAVATVRSHALDEVVDEVATRLAGPVVDAQLPLVLRTAEPASGRPAAHRRRDGRFANRFLQRSTDVSH